MTEATAEVTEVTEVVESNDGEIVVDLSKMQRTMRELRTELLECDLTTEERSERGVELAEALSTLQELDAAKKAAMAFHRGRIERQQAEVDRLAGVVTSGREKRDIDIEDVYDFHMGVVTSIRQDTGETHRSRVMTDKDRQMEMMTADPSEDDEQPDDEGESGVVYEPEQPEQPEEVEW